MKITYDSWYDRHENRYISLQEGNVLIQIQMHQKGKMTCYITISIGNDERMLFTRYRLETIKEANKFIKKTYKTYKRFYKLGKSNGKDNSQG